MEIMQADFVTLKYDIQYPGDCIPGQVLNADQDTVSKVFTCLGRVDCNWVGN